MSRTSTVPAGGQPQISTLAIIERGKSREPTTLAGVLAGSDAPSEDIMSKLFDFDKSEILVYDLAELLRVYLNLGQTRLALFFFRYYLQPLTRNPLADTPADSEQDADPVLLDLETSEGSLRRLSEISLVREALARGKGSTDPSSTPPIPQ